MFGLFKKKNGSETIELNKVIKTIEKELENEQEAIKNTAETSIREVLTILSDLDGAFASLKGKKSGKKYADSLKDKFCERSRKTIKAIEEPEIDYESLLIFLKNIKKAHDAIENIDFKEVRHLREFKADMNIIAKKTKPIENWIKNFERFLERSIVLEKSMIIRKNVTKVEEAKEKIRVLEKKEENIDSSIRRQKENIENFSSHNINTHKYEIMEEKLRGIESEMAIIKQKINTEFGILEKPLRKLLYSKKELGIHDQNIISKYIENSGEAFLITDTDGKIKKILGDIIEAAKNKEIETDEKRLGKIEELIRNMSLMVSMRRQYRGLEEKKYETEKTLEKEYTPLLKEIKEREEAVKEMKELLRKLENEKEAVIKEKNQTELSISESKKVLEDLMTEVLKRKIEIGN